MRIKIIVERDGYDDIISKVNVEAYCDCAYPTHIDVAVNLDTDYIDEVVCKSCGVLFDFEEVEDQNEKQK